MKKACAVLGLFALLTGCAAPQQNSMDAYPGSEPQNPEAIVTNWMAMNLKDPSSVQGFRISKPVQGQLWRGMIGGGYLASWVVCAGFNAKNSFGGYTGYQEHAFYIRNDSIIRMIDLPDTAGWNKFSCAW